MSAKNVLPEPFWFTLLKAIKEAIKRLKQQKDKGAK
jgi:hypothetical protein